MKDKHKNIVFQVIIFVMICYLAYRSFRNEYLFGWLIHNYKFFLLMVSIPLIFAFLGKEIVASFITAGITFGIFIGNFGGNILNSYNKKKIIEGMSAEKIYQLNYHYGFFIMIIIIFVFFVVGLVFEKRNKNK